jgi:hypothetical protein
MAVMLIARLDETGVRQGACADRCNEVGRQEWELGHRCGIGEQALYIISVREPEERVRMRWGSGRFDEV